MLLASVAQRCNERPCVVDQGVRGITTEPDSFAMRAPASSAALSDLDVQIMLDLNAPMTSEHDLGDVLNRIAGNAARLVDAERASLFLHDAKTDDLWTIMAKADEMRPLRFPAASGIIGHSFKTGDSVISDAPDQHPHFSAAIDAQDGLGARTLICLPVTTGTGRRLGVLHVVNKRGRPHFDPEDMGRLTSFAGFAAVTLENAVAFRDVILARNANDAILRSMSTGVMTLNRKARLLKINEACCRIMEVEPGKADTIDWWKFAEGNNDWIGQFLSKARIAGEAHFYLDFQIKTFLGNAISTNLSVVPLIGEVGAEGWLILIEDISEGKRLQGAMRRFMPQQIVDQVLDRDDELMFGSACQSSILFADIRGFTTLSERLTPRQTVDMLNGVFTELYEAVSAHKGIVDKYIGDAVMAVFGVPFPTPDDPLNAVLGAIAMLAAVDVLNHEASNATLPKLQLGIGIATGEVVAGTIGSPKRMDYTVIGDSVNLASRLQELTKTYGVSIIICEDTEIALPPGVARRRLDVVRVRGRQAPVHLFEVLLPHAKIAESLRHYAEGLAHLHKRAWQAAATSFAAAADANTADAAARFMLDRAKRAIANPPDDDWDGVW